MYTATNGDIGGRKEQLPTMLQVSEDRIATLPQQVDGKNTSKVDESLLIKKETCFTGIKGGSFVIDGNQVICANSGESQIYGCRKKDESGSYVAKVLISITPESDIEKRKTRDKVICFLDSESKNEASYILPLIDYGIIHVSGIQYYVEIYPYCEGGDLGARKGKLLYQEICDNLVLAVNEALRSIHSAGFVHRDLKPDNLYYYHDKVVIGDFGITCDLRQDGFATDKYKTGTLGYYAPELMSQAAMKASDYYSFGQTLWTLYHGEMMYQNIFRRYRDYGMEEQRNQINFAMLNSEYFGLDEIGREESFFEILIRGLLQYDPSTRFNYDQVCRWLNGDKSLSHEITKFDSKAIYHTPFKFHQKECWDNQDIHDTLVTHWETAKELLYSGVLRDFYVSQDFCMASEINEIIKQYSTLKARGSIETTYADIDCHNDIGVGRFFLLLNSGTVMVWKGKEYHSFSDLSLQLKAYLEKFEASLEDFEISTDITNLLVSELIGFWYLLRTEKNGKFDQDMAEAIGHIQNLAKIHTKWSQKVAYVTAYYLFADRPEEVAFHSCNTLEELALQIISNKYTYQNILHMIHNPYFYGFLFALGYEQSVFQLMTKLGKSPFLEIEMLYDFLSSQVKNQNILDQMVSYYRDYGPYAYLTWWKNHLDIYDFHGKEAEELKKEITEFNFTGITIDKVRKQFVELSKTAIRFRAMFVDNIFLAQMGFTKGKEQSGITSKYMDAYWHYNLLEREAPIGFGRAIGIGEEQCG